MSMFGNRDPEFVRAELLINGTLCGHTDRDGNNDCPTILQRARDGDLTDGVRAHWDTVHRDGE